MPPVREYTDYQAFTILRARDHARDQIRFYEREQRNFLQYTIFYVWCHVFHVLMLAFLMRCNNMT